MKISAAWLEKYFDESLPEGQELADAFTFHSFEVEEMEDDLLDLKVLPDRAGYGLCHRGVAYELAAALDRPLKHDPLREALPKYPSTSKLKVSIDDPNKCSRYMAAIVKGVKVGPSPDWLKKALESVGQRSINNIVDATNYVMLDIGQPLHAFDAGKLDDCVKEGYYEILVRAAREGEEVTVLTGDTYTLTPEQLLIVDDNCDHPIGIAGVKGGKAAEVTSETTEIIIESANFDGTAVRRTSQALKLVTDASLRFQNRPSPELCGYGMKAVLELIREVAGGEVISVVDEYPARVVPAHVSVTLSRINGLLGSSFTGEEVASAFARLGLPHEVTGEAFTVTPPFERTDLAIPEDLVEEVGRILGYDRIPPTELPSIAGEPDQARYRGIERMKDQLVEQGFTEVSTQSFAKKGDIYLANPLDKTKPAPRTSLEENLKDALERAKRNAPLVLPPGEKPKLFEVGTVFPKAGEYLELWMTEPAWEGVPTHDNLSVAKLEDYGKGYEPNRYELGAYKPFSAYPFITRDISMWTPDPVDQDSLETLEVLVPIVKQFAPAPEFLTPILFGSYDYYKDFKTGRTSKAFRLAFQATDRTLTDEEVNHIMEKIGAALTQKGYEIR